MAPFLSRRSLFHTLPPTPLPSHATGSQPQFSPPLSVSYPLHRTRTSGVACAGAAHGQRAWLGDCLLLLLALLRDHGGVLRGAGVAGSGPLLTRRQLSDGLQGALTGLSDAWGDESGGLGMGAQGVRGDERAWLRKRRHSFWTVAMLALQREA